MMANQAGGDPFRAARARVDIRLKELGISAREASRKAGFGLSFVGEFVSGSKRAMAADRMTKLAQALDLPVGELLSIDGADDKQHAHPIPRFGAIGSNRAFSPFSTRPIDSIDMPPQLVGDPEAYAFYVPNNAAGPRYEQGETLFLSTVVAPESGSWALLRTTDDLCGIIRVDAVDSDGVTFFDGDLGAIRSVSFADIRALHRIVGTAV